MPSREYYLNELILTCCTPTDPSGGCAPGHRPLPGKSVGGGGQTATHLRPWQKEAAPQV